MRVHAKVHIRGKVQGVFYRASAAEQAKRLSLAGFVRNLGDGSVEAEVEGEEKSVEAFLSWCRRGPPQAQVDSVETETGPARGSSGFHIR